jgi:hypothetical protein
MASSIDRHRLVDEASEREHLAAAVRLRRVALEHPPTFDLLAGEPRAPRRRATRAVDVGVADESVGVDDLAGR